MWGGEIVKRSTVLLLTIAFSCSFPILARAQREVTLYSFTGGSDGYDPSSPLVLDTEGNLYGTTYFAGTTNNFCPAGCGTVFQLAPSGGTWSFQTLHSFSGDATDVGHPSGPLAFDSSENLYGTGESGGGPYDCDFGASCGGAFELSRSADWNESIIYSFSPKTGDSPSGLIFRQGIFYGATTFGPGTINNPGSGTIYQLFLNKDGQWEHTVLHGFTGGKDAAEPSSLAFDPQGHIYGSTPPFPGRPGNGALFKLSRTESGLGLSVLDDLAPSPLIFDKNGNAYASLSSGGSSNCGYYGCGSVIEFQKTATGWQQITLYEFSSFDDGNSPGALVFDAEGNLYGVTLLGGTGTCTLDQYAGCGTVFKLTPGGNGWQKTTLYNFTGGSDGEFPNGFLTIDSAGNLYGATQGGASFDGTGYGTIFEIQQ